MKIERAHKILWPVLLNQRAPTKVDRRIIEDVMQKFATVKSRMRLSDASYQCYLDIKACKTQMSVPKHLRGRHPSDTRPLYIGSTVTVDEWRCFASAIQAGVEATALLDAFNGQCSFVNKWMEESRAEGEWSTWMPKGEVFLIDESQNVAMPPEKDQSGQNLRDAIFFDEEFEMTSEKMDYLKNVIMKR